eukprot:8562431-Pyramimonas_sp.AAC.1
MVGRKFTRRLKPVARRKFKALMKQLKTEKRKTFHLRSRVRLLRTVLGRHRQLSDEALRNDDTRANRNAVTEANVSDVTESDGEPPQDGAAAAVAGQPPAAADSVSDDGDDSFEEDDDPDEHSPVGLEG